MDDGANQRTYDLTFRFEPYLAEEHLGSQKYTTVQRALGELVANAFDARATTVDVRLAENDLGGLDHVVITDDGVGMTSATLGTRFVSVGVRPQEGSDPSRLGKFGVGRLAVHRIGAISEWQTVARDGDRLVKSTFRLEKGRNEHFPVTEEILAVGPTGTSIRIFNLLDDARPATGIVVNDLLGQFCAYLLANTDRRLSVNGQLLDVCAMVDSRETETLDVDSMSARVDHILLKKSVEASRFPQQVIFAAKGRTVATFQPTHSPSPAYLGIVGCDCLDQIVSSNRESVIDLDGRFSRLKEAIAERVQEYRRKLQSQHRSRFIERAREEEYYPFRSGATDPITAVKQVVYDTILEGINEHASIEGLTHKQKTVIFKLLNRAMENENLLAVLDEVASLTDESINELREVLRKTTLDSLIKLASDVTARLQFLDVLHDLVYGAPAKHLKERSQLHVILEPHAWLFGPQYHLATSDKSFREVIRRHRTLSKLPAADAPNIDKVSGVRDIPDLFLASQKEYPAQPKNHHLLVEIKAPKVSLGQKEFGQIMRYATTVSESQAFDKTTTRWDLFLVSAEVSSELELQRHQENKPPGMVTDSVNLKVWVVTWAELIQRSKEELHLARAHLQKKSTELATAEFLRERFPGIQEQLDQKRPAKSPPMADAPDET